MKYKEIDIIGASTDPRQYIAGSGTEHILEYIKTEFNNYKEQRLGNYNIHLKAIYFDYVPIATILALDSLYSYSVVWAQDRELSQHIRYKSKYIIDTYVEHALSPSFHPCIIKNPATDYTFGAPIISIYPSTSIDEISKELFDGTQISLEDIYASIDAKIDNDLEEIHDVGCTNDFFSYYWNYQSSLKYKEYQQKVSNYIFQDKEPQLLAGLTHHLYDRYLSPKNGVDTIYFNIPIIGADTSALDISYKGQAIAFGYLIFDNYDNVDISEHLRKFAQHVSPFIDYQIKNVIFNLLYGVTSKLQRTVKNESIKSAKAAIMSRNMSHNLGSHVMFYIKQKLQSVSKIINNDVLHNIITGSQLNIEELQEKLQNSANIELPFLVGLGRFINYLQERQDYIATVATNYIPARSTISFKDFIYDELKPDLRYERHKRNDSSSDNGWQPKNLLLDYIAYSEGYSKSDAIEIKFGAFDGHNPLDVTAETDFQALRKFNVAVPGGVIGRQAIFSIVENIIRNAAKHSEHCPDGKLVLQLSLVDAEKDFAAGRFEPEKFRCMRKEKGSEERGESLVKLYQNHKDAFHILRIKLDMPNKEDDIEALVGKLGEDYVEEDGSMKETSKGLKEMRISAAWLRGHSIDTAIPTTEPPVLAVYSEPYKDYKDKETISYFLCIPKPCKVAFVVDKELLTYIDDNGKESSYLYLNPMLEPFGCAVFGYDDEAKMLSKKRQNEEEQNKENKYKISDIADYEIVCMLLDGDKKVKINNILPYISSRYITNSATTKSILDELKGIAKPSKGSDQERKNNETQYAQIKAAIDSIYEKWLETAYPKAKNTKLVIADMRDGDSSRKDNSVLASDQNVLLTTTGNVTLDDCKDSVVYSTHFKGLALDGNYEKMLSNAACIDSVTGNNSTDRLIRQDEWTKEWKSKHLSAGLAKVAIFDERIFSTFITNEPIITKEKVESIIENNHEDPAQALCDLYKHTHKDEIGYDQADEIINDPKCIDNVIPAIKNAIYTHDTAQKNHERRIWAFDISIVENENENSVDIEGYKVSIEDQVQPYIKRTTDAKVTVANIMYDKENKKVILRDHGVLSTSGSKMFDYISIHQGILDKIYGVFGIKNNDAAKLEVTKAIHNCFSRHITPNDAKAFLPNFIIHSGRSKPNEKDMPQHQPFVQFAAIDHAVKDCKYTLVELLATAHYESNNNN